MEISFTIPIEPRTKKNSQRFVRNGARYILLPSKAFEEYQEKAGWYIKGKGMRIESPVAVIGKFYMGTHRRVDLLNLLEALCDVLVHYGVLKDDNSQIVVHHDGSRVMYDKENPRTEVLILEE